ncbi:MAG: rhomboid family intramembrane serine protease [Cytophagaceae bacterium]
MFSIRSRAAESLFYPFFFVAILWAIRIFESVSGIDLSHYGILPWTVQGLIGILFSPLIHGNFDHLMSNTLPLLILGIIVVYFYRKIAFEVFFWIYFMTGVWVWLMKSSHGYHIGASGLVYGFLSFLFFSGVFRKDTRSIALAILVTSVYGGLIWGIFPTQTGVSWQSHFFGALSGAICAYQYRKTLAVSDPPKEPAKPAEPDTFNPDLFR